MRKVGPLRYITIAFALGLVIAAVLLFANRIQSLNPFHIRDTYVGRLANDGQLFLWPTAIFLLVDAEDQNIYVEIISILANGLFYGITGLLLWLGLFRSRFLLAVPVLFLTFVEGLLFYWLGGY